MSQDYYRQTSGGVLGPHSRTCGRYGGGSQVIASRRARTAAASGGPVPGKIIGNGSTAKVPAEQGSAQAIGFEDALEKRM